MSQSILFRMKRFAVAPALMFALLSFAAQAEYEAGVHYFESVSYTHLTLPTICSV